MAEGSSDDVNIRFGASIDDLKSKMGEVTNIFGEVTKRFAIMAAAVAGGAAFKAFIDEANQANVAAEKMARTLGITADEAGVLAVAIDDIAAKMGVEAGPETYTQAFLKFNRALRSSSDELKAYGVDVDAVKNGTKTSNEVFLESLRLFNEFKPGIDQTQYAMKAFGKSVQEVQVLSQLTAKAIEDARKSAQELNLTITAEGMKAAEDYRVAMDNVGDVLQGLKKTIGEGVMPIFTQLASKLAEFGPTLVAGMQAAVETLVVVWESLAAAVTAVWEVVSDVLDLMSAQLKAVFGDDGPGAMEIFKNALRLVQAAFIALRIGVEVVAEVVKSGLALMASSFTAWANIAKAALNLDFAGMKSAWAAGVKEREDILMASANRLMAIGQRGADSLNKALVGAPAAKTPGGAPSDAGKGTRTAKIGDDGAEASAALALMKAKEDAKLALQLEYLRQASSIYEDAYAKNLIDTRSYYEAKKAIELQAIDATLAARRKEMEAAKTQGAGAVKQGDKLKFAAEEQKILGEINVLEAKRNDTVRANAVAYENAERERSDQLNTIRANRAKAGVESEISVERDAIQKKLALRQIGNDEALRLQAALENRSYAATQAALDQKQTLVRGDLAKQAELDAQKEAEENAHQQRLTQIANAGEMERFKGAQQIQDSSQAGFADMMAGIENGTLKVSDAFRNMGKFVEQTMQRLINQKFTEQLFDATGLNEAINQVVGMVSDGVGAIVKRFVLGETQKTAAEKVGASQRGAVRQTETITANSLTALKTEAAVIGEAVEGEAAVAGAATKIAADEGASGASIAATAASAIANIAARAWEVAASVYSALAGIPYVGPFIAPVAAIAATAVVLGFASRISSSEGGEYQVDDDRLNFVHKDETILPRDYAQGLRDLVNSGGLNSLSENMNDMLSTMTDGQPKKSAPAENNWWRVPSSVGAAAAPARASGNNAADVLSSAGVGRGGGDMHVTVQAIDARSVRNLFLENGRAIAEALNEQRRNFNGD